MMLDVRERQTYFSDGLSYFPFHKDMLIGSTYLLILTYPLLLIYKFGFSTLSEKANQKKGPRMQTEVQAVERYMKQFITFYTVPGKWDWERAEPEALKNRDWQTFLFIILCLSSY